MNVDATAPEAFSHEKASVPFVEAIAEQIRNRALIQDGATILVAFSGGPDSAALLDVLARLAPAHGWHLFALHLDHGLRSDSAAEAAQAAAIAAELGTPFRSLHLQVARARARLGMGVEEAARLLRHRALRRAARVLGAQVIALGHQADDQVETVFLRLVRGTGLRGMLGIPWIRHDGGLALVRPLLGSDREQVLAHCRARGIVPISDPSNGSPFTGRNRLRHEVVPVLEALNPDLVGAIARQQGILADEEAYLVAQAEHALADCLVDERLFLPHGVLVLDRGRFGGQPVALQRRVLRLVGARLKREWSFEAIEGMRRHLLGTVRTRLDLPGGASFMLSSRLAAWEAAAPSPLAPVPLCWGTTVEFPPGWRIRAIAGDAAGIQFDRDALPADACWRSGDPEGDRFQPWGHGRTHSLRRFFTRSGVFAPWRRRALVLACGREVLWVGWPTGPISGRRSALAAVGPSTRNPGTIALEDLCTV